MHAVWRNDTQTFYADAIEAMSSHTGSSRGGRDTSIVEEVLVGGTTYSDGPYGVVAGTRTEDGRRVVAGTRTEDAGENNLQDNYPPSPADYPGVVLLEKIAKKQAEMFCLVRLCYWVLKGWWAMWIWKGWSVGTWESSQLWSVVAHPSVWWRQSVRGQSRNEMGQFRVARNEMGPAIWKFGCR